MTMSESDRLAVAAHLHVLLRRKTGRVTDTEWMARNAEYAAEIVRFARERARDDGEPELADWAARLETAMALASRPAHDEPGAGSGAGDGTGLGSLVRRIVRPDPEKRYVGGLR